MFERFTDSARQVVVVAQEEARLLKHPQIGTEHILLGLLRQQSGSAAEVLAVLGIEPGAVRDQVVNIVPPGEEAATGHIPFSPEAKRVLELSLRESLQLGHDYIGTEHILLGLIREGDGVAARVLTDAGADLNEVRTRVVETVGGEEPKQQFPSGMSSFQAALHRMAAIESRLDSIDERLARIEDRLPPSAA